jgi:hypothetical protein
MDDLHLSQQGVSGITVPETPECFSGWRTSPCADEYAGIRGRMPATKYHSSKHFSLSNSMLIVFILDC